ncbi:MAG: hypothetical protein JMN27_08065 [gamma proteobacterium endosymbiont of Lamellibrachia anaximandri]|nr:hypothetical protein [gamma proteobacterium endosymbiont of Lamellibrachia anaximandri]MBL3533771.1 hypothetical protein [gamma proteobacterium endosymbiont of Lamellibrachia anaximandri]
MSRAKQSGQGLMFEELQSRTPYIIEQLEVYNWGPFSGLHRAEIDPHGSAIIGQTGSGKTTLVDALMTLVAARPLYNLASTGGHESDRDLVSYIRGVSGEGNESGDNAHIARSGSTVTAVGVRFTDGGQYVSLTGLFWLDGSSSSMSDLKRLWIFSRNSELGIGDWLELHREGGARAVKRFGREQSNLHTHDSKKAYLAQLRRFFEVGENAFSLLNRAAGLKQLNSIDALFRELVLEDKSAFKRAADVVDGFDVLKEIHSELEIARTQQQSLLPIEAEERVRLRKSEEVERLSRLKQILPLWFATQGHRLWQQKHASLKDDLAQREHLSVDLKNRQHKQEQETEDLHRLYIEQGGGNIEQLEQQITIQESNLRNCQREAHDYLQLAKALDLDATLSEAALAGNRQRSEAVRRENEPKLAELDQQRDQQGGSLFSKREREASLKTALQEARSHSGSNIDSRYLKFKQNLTDALGIDLNAVAYVAELVEIKEEERAWRGAIERAIGSHRLRLIVPGEQMQQALAWVNQRDNRLHVRLLDAAEYSGRASFLNDGFTHKLNFGQHPLREAIKTFLADIDRHCVDSSEVLHRTPHAMTVEGMMSGKRGQFDKQDQRRLDADWMTGFSNRDRLRELEHELSQVGQEVVEKKKLFTRTKERHEQLGQQIQLLSRLEELQFSEIDIASAETLLLRLRQQLEQLQDPDSDTTRAKEQWQQAKQKLHKCQQKLLESEQQKKIFQAEMKRAKDKISLLSKRMSSVLSTEQQSIGDSQFGIIAIEEIELLDEKEREASAISQNQLTKAEGTLSATEKRLISSMGNAKTKDTGALAETGTEIRDIPSYLQQLELLTKEALPEKVERFLEYLNKSSDEGVTQLLAYIDNETSIIEERIDELNQTMVKVDFQPGCYLQLQPRRVIHETLTAIQKAQRHLRSAALKEDQGESHYRALVEVVRLLRDAVERHKTVGAKALLDPRYRLQFYVSVIERDGERVIEVRTGSQGGSGGEKEIITSYILTASLSYALCPDGMGHPLFGTVVLDEAFSKSSQSVAARIIGALRQFGLHPLFITPNKEMRLLRSHTRSAILVHRRGQRATTTSLSWEELDQQARKRLERSNENA